mmetsp:Transcript_44837/g.136936  ORF Transcript_44837/g.136936 Transcript_44837/m.136936 type:complete len:203 (-) Transcript_44837:980-1588(-)
MRPSVGHHIQLHPTNGGLHHHPASGGPYRVAGYENLVERLHRKVLLIVFDDEGGIEAELLLKLHNGLNRTKPRVASHLTAFLNLGSFRLAKNIRCMVANVLALPKVRLNRWFRPLLPVLARRALDGIMVDKDAGDTLHRIAQHSTKRHGLAQLVGNVGQSTTLGGLGSPARHGLVQHEVENLEYPCPFLVVLFDERKEELPR